MARVAADARQTAPHGGFRNANRSARLDEPLFPDGRAGPPDSLLMLARVTLRTTEMGPCAPSRAHGRLRKVRLDGTG